MRDGIYIDAWVVRLVTLLLLAGVAFAIKTEYPAARRYLKVELM
jgi:hypothetical protein